MNAENLPSTKERVRILELVIFQTGPLSVNSIAKKLKLSKGLVSLYMDVLAREGVVKRTGAKFLMNHHASLVKGIKVLLNLSEIDTRIFKKYSFVEAVGLYGSCAKGENNEDSDVDMWIRVGGATESKIAALAALLRKKIKNVKPLFLSFLRRLKNLEQKMSFFIMRSVLVSLSYMELLMPLSYDDCLSKGLLKRIPPSKEQGKRSFDKAQRWLDEAKTILGSKAFNSSVSAAYLAMFHSARAILFTDEFREKSHACVTRYLLRFQDRMDTLYRGKTVSINS